MNDPIHQPPQGQGYPPPPKAPPHPMDAPAQGYPGYGPKPAAYPSPPPPYGAQPFVPPRPKPNSGKAIASLVCGLISVFFWPLAVLTGPAAIVLGWMALKETRPDGPNAGRGFAIAGMVMGPLMLVVALGIGALMGFAFYMADKQSKRHSAETEAWNEVETDQDLTLIQQRLRLYYIENKHSLGPGGPVVNDGGKGGLYDENSPRVTGQLGLRHLVKATELNRPMSEYTLYLDSDTSVRVVNHMRGQELVIEDIGKDQFLVKAKK
ncbi:MAG: DUF4190 domain-containing protein [Planctomycetes bacterium]|jgi:hypothetical protein|nr:DUF4190 domain-containing protein [Planctomycetota bacterium]MCL4731378.1 DUF4190 domain-containing protein [Planctomycetota bacterium]